MDNFDLKITYRDRSYKKYLITASLFKQPDYFVRVDFICSEDNQYAASFIIRFSDTWVYSHYGQDFPKFLISSGDAPLIRSIIRDVLHKTKIEMLDGKEILISNRTEYGQRIRKDKNGILNINLEPAIFAKENKFTRELVLRELYAVQNVNGSASRISLTDKCHYFDRAVRNAIDALISKGFINDEKANLTLSYSGLTFVEDRILSPFSDKIFLIAACQDQIYQMIDNVYAPAVDELGYTLIFQEASEPKGSIHDDMWEFIEECKLILCDLTYKRPNCFIEYGYALAKEKQIILCVEETEGKTKSGYMKIPFDTQNQKYSFWKAEWLSEEKHKSELDNFKDTIKERIKDKLAILDLESEI